MTSNRFDLRGKVAIVTGGNGGIGLGLAHGLADAGADIAVVGRNEAKSAAAVADLKARGVKAIAVTTDVTDKAAIAAMVAHVVKDLGRIDILINNAGMSIRKPPHELELDEWNTVINTNLTSAFLCSKLAYPALKASGNGKVINIGSMMSIFGASFATAYAACSTRAPAPMPGRPTTSRSTPSCRAGSTPTSLAVRGSRSRACTSGCCRARRRDAGATSTTLPASLCSSPHQRRISSRAPRSPSTAGSR